MRSRRFEVVSLGVGTCLLLFISFFLYKDFGQHWDSNFQKNYGDLVFEFFRSGFHDKRAQDYWDLIYYGGSFEVLASAWSRVWGGDPFDARNLFTYWFSMLGPWGLYYLGKVLQHRRVGYWAAWALMLMPYWFGHSYFNSKDIPFAVAFLWSVVGILAFWKQEKSFFSSWWFIALCIGFAAGIRVGGLLLMAYLGIVLVIRLFEKSLTLKSAVIIFSKVFALSWVLMILAWPWAHVFPLMRPFEALRVMSAHHHQGEFLTSGVYMPNKGWPFSYLISWFFAKIPMEWALGMSLSPVLLYRHRRYWVLQFFALFPVAYVYLANSTLYDEIRQLLFCLPLVLFLSVWAWNQLFQGFIQYWNFSIGLVFAFSIYHLVALHPLQYAYLSPLVGGAKKGVQRFEADYYAVGFKQFVKQIAASPLGEKENLRFHICGPEQTVSSYFSELNSEKKLNWKVVGRKETADYTIAYTRDRCFDSLAKNQRVLEFKREQATFDALFEGGILTP